MLFAHREFRGTGLAEDGKLSATREATRGGMFFGFVHYVVFKTLGE